MQGLDKLRYAFIAAGWTIHENHSDARFNRCDWVASNPRRDRYGPACACTDELPSVIAYPYELNLDVKSKSVEFDLTSQVSNGNWVKFRAFAVAPDETLKSYPTFAKQLYAAWAAANAAAD